MIVFFFKQKTAYEMRISDWSSDVCSSDLPGVGSDIVAQIRPNTRAIFLETPGSLTFEMPDIAAITAVARPREIITMIDNTWATPLYFRPIEHGVDVSIAAARSEEHTSELQSLMRIPYAVCSLNNKTTIYHAIRIKAVI